MHFKFKKKLFEIFFLTDSQSWHAPTISLFEAVVVSDGQGFFGTTNTAWQKHKKCFDNIPIFPSTTFVSISKHFSEQEIPTNQRLMMLRPS